MKKFLIVDDSQEDREMIRSWLLRTGEALEVVEAGSVQEGLELFLNHKFSCVLLDYTFPLETAEDFLNTVNADRHDRLQSPVIVITGRGNDELAVRCIKAGASDYINKHRFSESGNTALKIVERVLHEHEQYCEITRSRAAEKEALLEAVQSKCDLERSVRDLKRAKLSADAANVSKSSFLANMSHEIRSPLTSILGFTELLKESDCGTPLQQEYIRTIEKNGKHLLAVINEILDFSKVEAGKVTLTASRFHLVDLIHEVVDNFTRGALAKSVNLRVFFHPEFPTFIYSDATRIRQVLTNLISNSVKFTERGEVAVIARHEPATASQREGFSIVVSDSGEGISKEDAAKLFRRFAQANESISSRYGGTGLGLVLSRKLAHLLGGELSLISSEPGIGSLFKLVLPSVLADAPVEAVKPLPAVRPNGDALQNLKIVVVDDSRDNQVLLSHILRRVGATVECLSDGVEAVNEAASLAPDLVLMDVQMPHLDGREAAKVLRSRGFSIPIVGLTAHALPEERLKSEAAGFNDQLTKPINTTELIATILRLTKRFEDYSSGPLNSASPV